MGAQEAETEQQLRKREERSALEYPFEAPDTDGSLVEIAEGVFWVKMPMPMALSHINVYLLRDNDGWYLLDSGLNTDETRQIWTRIAVGHLEGMPVKGIICTHFHYDHAGLASWLMDYFQAPLYMSHGEYYTMRALASGLREVGNEVQQRFYQRAGMPDEIIEAMFGACRRDPFMPFYPPHFVRLREGDELKIGQRSWRVVVGEGHSPEHICLYSEADKLLISGDQLLPEISSNVLVTDIEPAGNPLALWLSSLEKLSGLHPDTLVMPSHGAVFRNLHARVEQLQNHHRRQLDLLMGRAAESNKFSAFDALNWMFERKLSPVEMMLAQGEALAHLSWLLHNEKLIKESSVDGVEIYSAV